MLFIYCQENGQIINRLKLLMQNRNTIILILVPASTARGGITNYYQVLKDEFSENIEYFERGSRTWPVRKGFIPELIRAYQDYIAFKKRLLKNDVALVQTTTSLGLNTTIRDGLFIKYANKKGIKTSVFFRGWDDAAESKIKKKYFLLFKYFFFNADCFITLSEKTKNKLKEWGFQRNIVVESTLVDKRLLINVNKSFIINKFKMMKEKKKINLLFLSRIEQRKGIYELLKAFKILINNHLNKYSFHLTVCGDGFELNNINNWLKSENISDISINGFVSGDAKRAAFEKAHIFIFPSHGEGMPNAVLEAMGFGLPVITTPVGGLVDFFIPDQNGCFIEINNPSDIVNKVEILIKDSGRLTEIALNNFSRANEHFRSDKVANRMENIFNELLSK